MTGIFPQIEVRVALMSGCSGSTVIVSSTWYMMIVLLVVVG